MKIMKKGDMYWIDFEESEYENIQKGLRPCVVTSREEFNNTTTLIVAPLSTRIDKQNISSHLLIKCSKYDLNADSLILVEQQRIINKEQLGTYIDSLDELDIFKLDYKLVVYFNINNRKENIFSKEYTQLTNKIKTIDSIIEMKFGTIEERLDLLEIRSKRLNALKILSEKTEINIKAFYIEPVNLNKNKKELEKYKNKSNLTTVS